MKLLTEYLEHALTFERLAAGRRIPSSRRSWRGRQPPAHLMRNGFVVGGRQSGLYVLVEVTNLGFEVSQ